MQIFDPVALKICQCTAHTNHDMKSLSSLGHNRLVLLLSCWEGKCTYRVKGENLLIIGIASFSFGLTDLLFYSYCH